MSEPLARAERRLLCDDLTEVGPDAATLCEGWTTRDLAAHLVVREARPDASVGIIAPPLAGWTQRVQDGAAKRPYADLVAAVRKGPPRFSVFALPGVDARANAMEYFIHHEDVRRAQPGWEPRDLSPETRKEAWAALRQNLKMLLRHAPVRVRLDPTDVESPACTPRSGLVVVRGPVSELAVHAFGRSEVRGLEFLGDEADVTAYVESTRSV